MMPTAQWVLALYSVHEHGQPDLQTGASSGRLALLFIAVIPWEAGSPVTNEKGGELLQAPPLVGQLGSSLDAKMPYCC